MKRYKVIHQQYTDLTINAEYVHGEIDGWMYFSGEFENPLNLEIEDIAVEEELREKLKEVSPHYQLINKRVVDKIRSKYSINDEFQALRTGDEAFDEYVAECVEWGKSEKAKIGF
jgi:hypothetical protein